MKVAKNPKKHREEEEETEEIEEIEEEETEEEETDDDDLVEDVEDDLETEDEEDEEDDEDSPSDEEEEEPTRKKRGTIPKAIKVVKKRGPKPGTKYGPRKKADESEPATAPKKRGRKKTAKADLNSEIGTFITNKIQAIQDKSDKKLERVRVHLKKALAILSE